MGSRGTRIEVSRWIWKLFAKCVGLDLDYRSLPSGERWAVVATIVTSVIQSRHLRPAKIWWLTRTPTWIVARRLRRSVHGWYRVPTRAAAEQVRLRFNIWPIELGDHVRIGRGRLTAIAYSNDTFSEIIFVLPNGEIEQDPHSPDMAKAWARFAATR